MPKRKYYRFLPDGRQLKIIKKQQKTPRSFKRKMILLFKAGLVGVALLFLFILIAFAYYAKDLPNPKDVLEKPLTQSTKIYDRTDKVLLYEIYENEKRTVVSSNEISLYLKQAIVSIEDKDFYKHPGIDLRGILRSVWVAIKTGGGELQGASTITQQFIRNSLLTTQVTLSRKIKEIILSLELERKYSKEEILTFYLNQISFGSNVYGVESAAKAFFAKNAKDVTLAEAAILAAIPKAPSKLSPYGDHVDLLKNRQALVLSKMESLGYISKEEKTAALKEEIIFQKQTTSMKAPHFVMYIKELLEEKYGKDLVEKGGLRVTTTLDWDLQEKTEKILQAQAEKNEKEFRTKNAALVTIDPKTGEILSMIGSRDYFDIENDGNVNVALRPRQPGSAFKPFVYATAFKKGYTPDTILFDVTTEFNPNCVYSAVQDKDQYGLDCYHPQDFDGNQRGPISMHNALAQSLNIPAVKTLYLVGLDDALKTAKVAGITTLDDRNRFGLSLVLGGGEVKLLELASAYGIFATEGFRTTPYSILQVKDNQGKILEKTEPIIPEQVMDSNICRMINMILSDNQARTPVFGANSTLYLGDIPVAAKTGTTQEYRDGWTIGYTPEIVIGVWTGNNDNSPMERTTGIRTAGAIWHDVMLAALENKPHTSFTPPITVVPDKPIMRGELGEIVKIDKISGKRATSQTPPELIEERVYRQAHSILYYVNKDNPQGPQPTNPEKDPQFKNWEEAVKLWAQAPERQSMYNETPPAEFDNIHIEANKPIVSINAPENGAVLSANPIEIAVQIKANYDIKQADFFFDDQFLGSKVNAPYEWNFKLTSTEDMIGRHKLLVKAYDIYLNANQASINVYTNISETSSQNNIIQKLTLSTPQETDFPYTIDLAVSGNLVNFKLYYSKNSDLGNGYLITKNWQEISSNHYQYIWNTALQAGDYYLYAIAEDQGANMFLSNKILISVP